jgi:Zn-dependent protease
MLSLRAPATPCGTMGRAMPRRASLQLARLFGVRVGADYSWLLVLFLVIFFFQEQFRATVDASSTTIYLVSVAAAFLFFGSIVFHELGHALAARREGIEVAGIDLFLFGGLMRMRTEPETPGAEFRVGAAGPAATALVIVAGIVAGVALEGWSGLVDAATFSGSATYSVGIELVASIVAMNVFVLAFNLVPAYPLDGARIVRSVIWRVTGDRARGTRAVATVGRAFAWLLVLGGIALAARGQTFNGVYLAILGWLLGSQARGAAVQTAVTQRLEGVTVADIMDPEPVTIPADVTTLRAYEEYFLRYYGHDWFAVTTPDGGYLGRAYRVPITEAADGPNAGRPVSELTGADPEGRVRDDVSLEVLLTSEPLRRLGALMAVDADGRLRGVVTAEAVARALRARLAH